MNIQDTIKDSSYIDFGMSFGSSFWRFVDYPAPNYTGVLNEKKMGEYLNSLFAQMKNAGQDEVFIAFAQLDNLDSYYLGDFSAVKDSSYDVVTSLLQSLQNNHIAVPGYKDFLDYFIQTAHQNGIKVQLSFGGMVAPDSAFQVLQNQQETYQGQADKLANFMKKYDIDGVDFDIESPSVLSSARPDSSGGTIFDFFKELHSQIEPEGRTSTLTSMLGQSWRSVLSPLLSHFTDYFDALNLMAYSDTQYWLDPNTPAGCPDQGWTIEEWIDAIGRENAGMVHVGFDDGVPYASPQANGGQYAYPIQPGSTNGQAAAQIYLKLLEQLKKDGYEGLGNPFFWPASNVQPNGQSRYGVVDNNQSNFVSSDMKDFYDWLKDHA